MTPQRHAELSASITEGLRAQILDELPEIADIADEGLREGCVTAWCLALLDTSWRSIREMPPAGNPGKMVLKEGDQTHHIRGVTRLARAIADELLAFTPDIGIDRDVVIAGGILHDVGKPWEFDPDNRARWTGGTARTGLPSLRHPVYGAHLCLLAGLPETIAHIAAGHSGEGELGIRSLEGSIVHMADIGYWQAMLSAGRIEAGTLAEKYRRPLSL